MDPIVKEFAVNSVLSIGLFPEPSEPYDSSHRESRAVSTRLLFKEARSVDRKMSSESEIERESEDEAKHEHVFSEPWNDSDLVLTLRDKKFHVHRCILSLQSMVFKAMFNGDFQEAKQGHVELHDDDHKGI